MSIRRHTGNRQDRAEGLAAEIAAAMMELGWLGAQSDGDVAQAEAELAARPIALPAELRDVAAAWDRRPKAGPPCGALLKLPVPPEIQVMLARAARQAGRLSPEIEQRMRQDRRKAEEEMDADPGRA